MPTLRSLLAALPHLPVQPLETVLVRQVPLEDLVAAGLPPDFLFTSGRPNRYNPAGVECVYFAEDERTASAERAAGLPRRLAVPCAWGPPPS